jgi:hypothetical protein
MVSPVRIRVPPHIKVLQIVEKERALAVLLRVFFRGVSTAGSRKGPPIVEELFVSYNGP